jgi:hypothetical protein
MSSLIKTTTRILSALLLCAAVSACAQSRMQGSFPVPADAGSYSAPTIMDY